jgi:hypothetical protein
MDGQWDLRQSRGIARVGSARPVPGLYTLVGVVHFLDIMQFAIHLLGRFLITPCNLPEIECQISPPYQGLNVFPPFYPSILVVHPR